MQKGTKIYEKCNEKFLFQLMRPGIVSIILNYKKEIIENWFSASRKI